jgi:hypothetical protein
MAAVNAYVGSYYLLLYAGWPRSREHLPFALLCVSLMVYDIACAGLYSASDLPTGVFWQGLQLAAVNPISACVVWFVGVLTGHSQTRGVRFFITAFALLLPFTLLVRVPGLTLATATPVVKAILWNGQPLITYYESRLGVLSNAAVVLSIVAYLYVFALLWRAYRRAPTGALVAIVVGQLAYFVGVVNDILVANQLYPFIYVSEYTYLVVVVVMAGVLLNRFVALHRAVEATSQTLEHEVQDARADLKVLRGLLPICASCKRIRDDQGRWNQVESYVAARTDATFSHGVCPDCLKRLYPDLADSVGGPPS